MKMYFSMIINEVTVQADKGIVSFMYVQQAASALIWLYAKR